MLKACVGSSASRRRRRDGERHSDGSTASSTHIVEIALFLDGLPWGEGVEVDRFGAGSSRWRSKEGTVSRERAAAVRKYDDPESLRRLPHPVRLDRPCTPLQSQPPTLHAPPHTPPRRS